MVKQGFLEKKSTVYIPAACCTVCSDTHGIPGSVYILSQFY